MQFPFRPKVYLSARIAKEQQARNNEVANVLAGYFEMFLPHEFQHGHTEQSIYNIDIAAMEQSDLAVLLPPYGRDCAWETGWYLGKRRPYFILCHDEIEWSRDVMVKGSVSAVICTDELTYAKLKKDEMLRGKVYHATDLFAAATQIFNIFSELDLLRSSFQRHTM